jgi:hypothetical protein
VPSTGTRAAASPRPQPGHTRAHTPVPDPRALRVSHGQSRPRVAVTGSHGQSRAGSRGAATLAAPLGVPRAAVAPPAPRPAYGWPRGPAPVTACGMPPFASRRHRRVGPVGPAGSGRVHSRVGPVGRHLVNGRPAGASRAGLGAYGVRGAGA